MSQKILKYHKFKESLILYRRSLIYQVKEFFANSTLHGVRYITQDGRSIGEKFMWFCFTSTAAVTALIIIFSLWEKFQTNPTITGLDTDFVLPKVAFPTTVVCPSNSYNAMRIKELAHDKLSNYDEESAKKTEIFLKMLMNVDLDNVLDVYNAGKHIPKDKLKQLTLRNWVFQIVAECSEIFVRCSFRNEIIDCCTYFELVYTEIGVCYAFNSRFHSIANSDQKSHEPHVVYETDKTWALYVEPTNASMIAFLPDDEYINFDVLPMLPWNAGLILLRMSKITTYTTEDARQLTIGQRKCIFHDEVKLKYFPDAYTYTSCTKECRIRKSLEFCNCNPPFYKPIDNERMCDLDDFLCLDKYKVNITNNDCHCELSCIQSIFNIDTIVDADVVYSDDEVGFTMEFTNWPSMRYKREVLFGWLDLLVSFGGIAGLFLGFSLLSAVEIVYYFTLRACCMVYKNREELYRMDDEIRRKPPPPINLKLAIKKDPSLKPLTGEYRYDGQSSTSHNISTIGLRKNFDKNYISNSRLLFRQPNRITPPYKEMNNSKQYGQYLP